MPISFATSKLFRPRSISFEQVQIFLNAMIFYLIDLSIVKNIWSDSKNIEHGQNILNTTIFFELADGLGMCLTGNITIM